ncbi:MAG: response regulator, partial [bacterium]|nr:response regulator [bacterium]
RSSDRGYEVCRGLRRTHPMEELPVFFLTAKNQTSDVVTGLSLGANDYLTKPVARDELLARVRPHLDLLHVHRNLEDLLEDRSGASSPTGSRPMPGSASRSTRTSARPTESLPRGTRRLVSASIRAMRRFGLTRWLLSPSLLVMIALLPRGLEAQSATLFDEVGRFYVQNFGPETYGAGVQNWAVIQDERGIIYVGNNHG